MADCSVRAKQSTAANFKAHCHTEKGKSEIRAFLDGVLSLQHPFDAERQDWCSWLIAGGRFPDEFKDVLRSYDTPTICGLVWNKNFVAYRCRDCGISPCMSLCADCFHAGNHEGHDFNMFKSQAGGACDCGDEDVMRKEGFCHQHGSKDTLCKSPPPELLAMAHIVVLRLCVRLQLQLKELEPDTSDHFSNEMQDAEALVEFLVHLCDTNTMKTVAAECLMMKIVDVDRTYKERKISSSTSSSRSHVARKDSTASVSSLLSSDSFDGDIDLTFLDFLMNFVTQFEFPQKIVTFLLHLLPSTEYKEAFTRVFCQHYQKIGRALVATGDSRNVEQLSNRVVHVSVQLFSNKILAEKVVREQNLLYVVVKVLHDMMRPSLVAFKRGDKVSCHLVVNCDDSTLRHHCYWPIVSDFINVLSHKTIAEIFMLNTDLVKQWMAFIGLLTGMNLNCRKLLEHVEYEPSTYYSAFSVELEAASSLVWSLRNACVSLKNIACVKNMINGSIEAIERWYRYVDNKPRQGEVTFHFPLHRHLAAFISVAVSQLDIPLEEVVPSQELLRNICEDLLHVQAAICEIRAGRWVRNGFQIRSQARLYMECHFCNSMLDLDIFLLQVCAIFLDPEVFINTMLECFNLKQWFQFGVPAASSPPSFDADTEVSMVEGMLTLIVTLLSTRLYLGLTDQEILRQEMVAQLCMGDKTHSQLIDLIPDKPGQSHNTQEFEGTLSEVADYKAPGFESGLMQQGTYVPKDSVWKNDFDFVHVMLRAVQRQDVQASLSRYTAHVTKVGDVSSSAGRSGSSWPPFQPLKPLGKYNGLSRILCSKTLHAILFFIFHKAVEDSSSSSCFSSELLYLSVYLTKLAVETKPLPSFLLSSPKELEKKKTADIGCTIVHTCIDFLDSYGTGVKDLYQVNNHHHLNRELLLRLQRDPFTSLDQERDFAHDVCAVMAHAIHHLMKPPLFEPFLPFMNDVLTSALHNQSSAQEKIAQLQYIQYLIQLQPPNRRELLRRLTSHLLSVSERLKLPAKNLALVSDEIQPLEMSMLLMYLIKYHEWLFRLYKVPAGWPESISDLHFPSTSMEVNVRHVFRPVSDAMDTSETAQGVTNQPDCHEAEGTTVENIERQPSNTKEAATSGSLESTKAFKGLVEEFIRVTDASESVAVDLIRRCRGNLEVAINIHFNMAQTLPQLDTALDSFASSPDSSSKRSAASVSRDGSEATSPGAAEGINHSILTLLMMLKSRQLVNSGNKPKERNPVSDDGVHYLTELFDVISKSSPENAAALRMLQSGSGVKDTGTMSPEVNPDDAVAKTMQRRKLARERQQKVLAEFASKQKVFMEKAMKKDPDALEKMDVDGGSGEAHEELFDCVICGQASASTEDTPVGLVALLQPSAVLGHRSLHVRGNQHQLPFSREDEEAAVSTCNTVFQNRYSSLRKRFDSVPSLDASASGTEGGVHIQSCGHHLHIHCHQSYLKSLQVEDAHQLHQIRSYNPRNGEFTCPMCRQLGNCMLPIIPVQILPKRTKVSKRTEDSCIDGLSELHAALKRFKQHTITKLTASALNFNVLGAAVKAVVDSVCILDGEDHRTAEKKFNLLYKTARTNLELEQVDQMARKLSSPRKSCFGALLRAFQFHTQTLVGPLMSVWSDLTGTDELRNHSSFSPPTDCPLLLRDALSLLIQMMLSWHTPLSLRDFKCLVQLVFNLVFTQSLVDTCCKFVGDEKLSWQVLGKKAASQERSPNCALTADQYVGYVCLLLSNSHLFNEDQHTAGISQSVWSPHTVERSLQDSCLGFLRLAFIMASLCYDVHLPAVKENDDEFRLLAAALDLCTPPPGPTTTAESFSCVNCLSWPQAKPLMIIRQWCEGLLRAVTQRRVTLTKDLLPNMSNWPPPKLLRLPDRYDSLIQFYRKRKCTCCGNVPVDPAVCLVCGKLTCHQGSCCFSATHNFEYIQHALDCGRGTGIFLVVLSSVIIITRSDRVSVWGSVYLDSFGEEDRDLRRGKPLFLSRERFDRLEEQWLTHSFDHMCKRWQRHLITL